MRDFIDKKYILAKIIDDVLEKNSIQTL